MSFLEKIIFDTNTLRDNDTSLDYFFWNRGELEKFSKVAEIVIPNMALWELRRQKYRSLQSKKDLFLKNPFHWLRELNTIDTENFDNKAHVQKLEDTETIKYTEIDIKDFSILGKIKDFALDKLPPFESWDGTDKGFKDAYIYFTLLEYLQLIPDKYIFVCTDDSRMKLALKKHQNIILVENFSDYQLKSLNWLCDEYFLWRLSEYIIEQWFNVSSIDPRDIKGFWLNIDGKQVLEVQIEWYEVVILVEDREIIEHQVKALYENLIQDLIESWTWGNCYNCSN